jgi:hypothetical protein
MLTATLFAWSMSACGVQDADAVAQHSAIGGTRNSGGQSAVELRDLSGRALADPGHVCDAITVETVAATRGSSVLDMSVLRTERTEPMTVTITRRDFVEVHERRPFGIEQSWRFDHAVGQTGALSIVVRLPGLTYLGRAAAGLHFQGQGCDAFYGDGTWIDAAGRRVALPARAESGSVMLFVPAEVVAGSAYPVVLDPQIEVTPIGGVRAPVGQGS